MKPVVVRPAAEEDIEAAYVRYEGRQAHLGNEFLFAIPKLTPSSIPMFAEWWCRGFLIGSSIAGITGLSA